MIVVVVVVDVVIGRHLKTRIVGREVDQRWNESSFLWVVSGLRRDYRLHELLFDVLQRSGRQCGCGLGRTSDIGVLSVADKQWVSEYN